MNPEFVPPRIAVARIAAIRGNRGEVAAELHTDFPQRFDNLAEVWLELADGRLIRTALEEAWVHRGRQILKFAGYDSIAAAETLVGAWVQVDASEAMALPEGTFFDHDLVGCEVIDLEGRTLGIVEEVLRIPANHQLVVRQGNTSILIPTGGSICREVSLERKRIVVDPPEGLVDLNK